jgi:uncharacterized protein (DUF2267 family)
MNFNRRNGMAEQQSENLESQPGVAPRRPRTPEQRAQRSESRRSTSFMNFLKRLTQISGMSNEEAEKASVSVLCALEQRLTGDEVFDLESQLPAKLRDLLVRCERHEGKPPRKFGIDEFYDMVARDLSRSVTDIKPVVGNVIVALRDQISAGESEDVASQLPGDLAALWNNP